MWRRRRALKGLDEDIRDHVARETEENVARGMAPEEGRRRALLTFGNVPLAIETTRQVWSWVWLDQVRQDLRDAARTLRRNPAFAATAAATLALAIGANTAMFSVLHAVVLRPLPYESPDELAMVWSEDPARNLRERRSSLWNVEHWRGQAQSFSDFAVYDVVSVNLMAAGGTERILGVSVSENLLMLLGMAPVLGRGFSPGETVQGGRPVLISDGFWQERFGRSADALGATLVLNGVPSEIIGVVPAGFRPVVDVWQPLPIAAHASSRPGGEDWFVICRLRAGVTVDQAQAEMTTIARRLNDGLAPEDRRAISVVPLRVNMVGAERLVALWLLGGAVFCVLLIAAANVTSLSLARGFGRAREMALRAALGASVPRIVRQVLVEGVVLAAVSGLIGTLLAAGGIHLIRTFGPDSLPRLSEMSLDLGVLGWTVAISLLTGLVVGLAPAIMTTRPNLRISGGEGGRSVSNGMASRRIRRALVVAECALAIVLLVGAGLLIRSWQNVTSTDPGFRPERVLALGVSSPAGFTALARADLYTRMLERIRSVPGVESVGMIGDLISGGRARVITTEGVSPSEHDLVLGLDEASPDAFRALGTPLLRGRFFSASDRPGTPRVAIINDAMARRLWPGRDPVGARLKVGAQNADGQWFIVVGVVGDMQRQGPEREPIPQMFEALAQTSAGSGMDVFVRTSIDTPLALVGAVRAAVHDVEPLAPVYGAASLNEMLGGFLDQRRFETWLLSGFALAALLMAAVGLYGILQYSIATRTREIGLRMAVGARPADVFRMLIREGVQLSAIGLVLGLGGALLAGRVSSRLLFGVTPWDPWTFAGSPSCSPSSPQPPATSRRDGRCESR